MSAMAKLVGVECVECRRKGHGCQAQMFVEKGTGSREQGTEKPVPLCLRCANEEPCCYETALAMETPRRLAEEMDLCVVPSISREDRAMLGRIGRAEPEECDEATKAAALEDLKTMKCGAVAEKYGIRLRTVAGWKSRLTRDRELRGEFGIAALWKERRRRERALGFEAVERVIGGETVRMAPMAMMGAEMLEVQGTGSRDQGSDKANADPSPAAQDDRRCSWPVVDWRRKRARVIRENNLETSTYTEDLAAQANLR